MHRERVKMLRDMLEGIPEERVNLRHVFLDGDSFCPPKQCEAIACMAGWAWIYPPFLKEGIRELPFASDAMAAAANFFDVEDSLFSPKLPWDYGTDKEVALARLDKLLK